MLEAAKGSDPVRVSTTTAVAWSRFGAGGLVAGPAHPAGDDPTLPDDVPATDAGVLVVAT